MSCFRKELHIKYRNLRFAKRTKRTFNLTENVVAYIDGLVLGDACIQKTTPRLTQTFAKRYLEWAKIIKRDLSNFGISSNITLYDTFDKRTNKTYELAALQTLGYIQFKDFRKRWYPEGKKVVPKDLILFPYTIRNWHLGDGSYSGAQLKFATDGFDDVSILYLKKKLEELGFHPFISKRRIHFGRKKERNLLLNIIEKLPLCFSHREIGGS